MTGQFMSVILSVANPLSANPTKWPNTLKKFVGNFPTNCLSVFGHFVNLAFKGNVVSKLPMVRYLLEGVLKRNEVSIGRHECSDLQDIP